MIDMLIPVLPDAADRPIQDALGLSHSTDRDVAKSRGPQLAVPFVLVTLHWPSNVDDWEMLAPVLPAFRAVARHLPLFFPVHPRTRRRIKANSLLSLADTRTNGPMLLSLLGYVDFLYRQRHTSVVITNSGGIKEETACLGMPYLTLRENTKHPVTATICTNTLLGPAAMSADRSCHVYMQVGQTGKDTSLWYGRAAL